jgi:hypothetical protein
VVGFRLLGAPEPEPDPEQLRWLIGLAMRDGGLLGEPVVSFSKNDDGSRRTHLDWPSVAEHAEDPEHARLLTLARLPLDREIPELDNAAPPDPEREAAVELAVLTDRAERAFVRKVAEAAARMLFRHRAAERRIRRGRDRQPVKEPPKQWPARSRVRRPRRGW